LPPYWLAAPSCAPPREGVNAGRLLLRHCKSNRTIPPQRGWRLCILWFRLSTLGSLMGVNADVLTALAAILALPISLFAAHLSNRADARSKVAARTQVYLALRQRFFHVHSQLPAAYSDPNWYPEAECCAF
jgi:hypothetical protein